jgi:hypothetical protein
VRSWPGTKCLGQRQPKSGVFVQSIDRTSDERVCPSGISMNIPAFRFMTKFYEVNVGQFYSCIIIYIQNKSMRGTVSL